MSGMANNPPAGTNLPATIARLERAAERAPQSEAAHYALACAWLAAGEAKRALKIFATLNAPKSRFADRIAAKAAEARAMLQADRSPAPYVRHLFDQFAQDYDRRMLDDLSYCAHRTLRALADMVNAAGPGTLDILDLGCGTGLTGGAFKDVSRRLDGVDLSPRMIRCARARGIYDTLSIGDAEDLGAKKRPVYDLIVSADTLVYLGDLRAVFHGAHRRLRSGGFFLFTAERRNEPGYGLGPKRRYAHSESYLREQAERAGFDVMGLLDCSPRHDAGVPVAGIAAAFQRR
jgi:predicted TPR repeat methyltransferase